MLNDVCRLFLYGTKGCVQYYNNNYGGSLAYTFVYLLQKQLQYLHKKYENNQMTDIEQLTAFEALFTLFYFPVHS